MKKILRILLVIILFSGITYGTIDLTLQLLDHTNSLFLLTTVEAVVVIVVSLLGLICLFLYDLSKVLVAIKGLRV